MKKFVDACIERPVSVAMFTIAIAIFGIVSFTRLPLSLLPDISYPTLTVETQYPGAAPAEVESLVDSPPRGISGCDLRGPKLDVQLSRGNL